MSAEHPGRKSSSSSAAPVHLLTGRPVSGKTTVLRQIVATLADRAGGFYVHQVRAYARCAQRAGERALSWSR